MVSSIFAAARPLCHADDATLLALCRSALARLGSRLKPGLTPEDCGEDFVLAAALLACADCAGDPAAFRVGEISVDLRESRADALRRAAEGLLLPFTEDDQLCFLRMMG